MTQANWMLKHLTQKWGFRSQHEKFTVKSLFTTLKFGDFN